MKITALEEFADFATLDTKNCLASSNLMNCLGKVIRIMMLLSSKALITSARVGGHDANPINTTVSSALQFTLSSLVAASVEQYESIPDNEIALLVRKF
jgi:hypothetical protein